MWQSNFLNQTGSTITISDSPTFWLKEKEKKGYYGYFKTE